MWTQICRLAALTGLLALSGCYMADQSIIGSGETTTPWASITYRPETETEATTADRQGDGYVAESGSDKITLRFLPLGDDWYVAELGGTDSDSKAEFFYGYMHVDMAKHKASVYAALADTKANPPPGMHACKEAFCIDSLDAYIAHARAIVDAGTKPDTIYDFKTTD